MRFTAHNILKQMFGMGRVGLVKRSNFDMRKNEGKLFFIIESVQVEVNQLYYPITSYHKLSAQ